MQKITGKIMIVGVMRKNCPHKRQNYTLTNKSKHQWKRWLIKERFRDPKCGHSWVATECRGRTQIIRSSRFHWHNMIINDHNESCLLIITYSLPKKQPDLYNTHIFKVAWYASGYKIKPWICHCAFFLHGAAAQLPWPGCLSQSWSPVTGLCLRSDRSVRNK